MQSDQIFFHSLFFLPGSDFFIFIPGSILFPLYIQLANLFFQDIVRSNASNKYTFISTCLLPYNLHLLLLLLIIMFIYQVYKSCFVIFLQTYPNLNYIIKLLKKDPRHICLDVLSDNIKIMQCNNYCMYTFPKEIEIILISISIERIMKVRLNWNEDAFIHSFKNI